MTEVNIIPFGKYKGRSIADVAAADPSYLQWCMQQNWFVEQYAHLVVNVTNFVSPSEATPAHNAMQVRFLDEEYRYAFAWAAFSGVKECEVGPAKFELISDVVFDLTLERGEEGCRYDATYPILVELKPSLGDDFPAVLRQIKKQRERVDTAAAIYRSPFGGRKDSQDCVWVLLIGEYTGTGATLDQLREVFWADTIYVVTADEVSKFEGRI